MMERSHFRKVIFSAKLIFIIKMKMEMIYEAHFHHRNDFSANGNGNPMAETHFHSLKVISIGPEFIFMQPKLISITEMEMTFAGGNSFSFP